MLLKTPYPDTVPFVPTDLTGLILWMKGDADVYKDNDVTLATADGDDAQVWRDQSGNGYKFSWSTTDCCQLKTGANGINGRNVVYNNGVGYRWMYSTTNITHGIGTGNFWTLAVVKRIGSPGSNWDPYFSIGNYNPQISMRCDDTDVLTTFAEYGKRKFSTVITAGPHLIEWGRESGYYKAVVDGTADATTFNLTGAIGDNTGMYLFGDGGTEAEMCMGEFLLYANKPSDDDLVKLRTYLNGRWAVY